MCTRKIAFVDKIVVGCIVEKVDLDEGVQLLPSVQLGSWVSRPCRVKQIHIFKGQTQKGACLNSALHRLPDFSLSLL